MKCRVIFIPSDWKVQVDNFSEVSLPDFEEHSTCEVTARSHDKVALVGVIPTAADESETWSLLLLLWLPVADKLVIELNLWRTLNIEQHKNKALLSLQMLQSKSKFMLFFKYGKAEQWR